MRKSETTIFTLRLEFLLFSFGDILEEVSVVIPIKRIMGKSLFIVLAVCLMSGVYGESISESISCSIVNGHKICNRERNQGNTAMSSSSSFSGPDGSSQNTYAGAGNAGGDWQSSEQSVVNGNGGPTPGNSNYGNANSGFQGATGGFGGPPGGGFSYTYSSAGSVPNFGANADPMPTGGGFGFESAGNAPPPGFPFNYVPRVANPPQGSRQPNGGSFAGSGAFAGAGGFAGAGRNFGPRGFDPFAFVFGRR